MKVLTEIEFRAVLLAEAKRNSLEWEFALVVLVWRADEVCHTHTCLNLFSIGDKTGSFQEAWVSSEIIEVLLESIRFI